MVVGDLIVGVICILIADGFSQSGRSGYQRDRNHGLLRPTPGLEREDLANRNLAKARNVQNDGADKFCGRPRTYPPNRLTSFEPLAASICWPVRSEPTLNPIVMRFLTRRAACFSLE
jgi:hypothetical protein